MLLENANNQKNEFSKEISKQITEGIKKTKNVFELEKNINLNLGYLQKKFTVAKLVGYFDKLDLKKEFQEEKSPFDLKFDEAIKYFSDKEPTLFSKINEITEEVTTNFFWIKKSTDLTVTKKIFENLKTSIDTGGTFKEWKENIADVLESTGLSESGYYLENVFRTNLLSAYNAGTYQQQMDNSEDFPYLMYDSVMDGRTTDFCTGHNGKIYKFDDKIWDIIYPPNHFGCRAGVISLSKEDIEEMGIKKIPRSTEKEIKDTDLKTFSGNPGKNYWKTIEKNVKLKEKELNEKMFPLDIQLMAARKNIDTDYLIKNYSFEELAKYYNLSKIDEKHFVSPAGIVYEEDKKLKKERDRIVHIIRGHYWNGSNIDDTNSKNKFKVNNRSLIKLLDKAYVEIDFTNSVSSNNPSYLVYDITLENDKSNKIIVGTAKEITLRLVFKKDMKTIISAYPIVKE